MHNKYHHIAMALAGICQSTMLVPQLANTGVCDQKFYDQSIQTIFMTHPDSYEDVYGGLENLKVGLNLLLQLLTNKQKHLLDVLRYLFASLSLTQKLTRNPQALLKIDQRLTHILALYPALNEACIQENNDALSYSLAGIYVDLISPLSIKIKVTGKLEFLKNNLVQAKVRTALLGSVRSAILWQQSGGSKLQFIFARKKIFLAASELLQKINQLPQINQVN